MLLLLLAIISLAGSWTLDYQGRHTAITLPASMTQAGEGNDVSLATPWTATLYDSSYYHRPDLATFRRKGNIALPFFLTPKKHYIGQATYTRRVAIPKSWRGQDITLTLERPHITTTVSIDGQSVGSDSSLTTPHRYDLTPFVKPGREATIAITVDNRPETVNVGPDSHSVSDQMQGNWNGLVGALTLTARPRRHIASLRVFTVPEQKAIDVRLTLAGATKPVRVALQAAGASTVCTLTDTATVRLALPDTVRLWDEFTPALYTLTATLERDTVSTTFGLRHIEARGRDLYLNGHPIFLRGTVENCGFPLTGYPPTEQEPWDNIMARCREYGINHIRFHSYCPPEAAFAAADRAGIYLQPECPSWPNHGVKLGVGQHVDTYLTAEADRIIAAYGNHPSFLFLAAGNEPAGAWVPWGAQWVEHCRKADDRRLYCTASVGGGWAWDAKSQYHVKGGARGLDWVRHAPQAADDFRADMDSVTEKRRTGPVTFPVNAPRIGHEVGQWCAFPVVADTTLYTGVFAAGNLRVFQHLLRQNGMASQADDFINASGRLQVLAYKYDIERNLRTPHYAGFQLLGLNDYTGQGTATVGVLNAFWQPKPYITPEAWREFCSPTVPLLRLPALVFVAGDTLRAPIELYHAAPALPRATAAVYIDGKKTQTVYDGALQTAKCQPLGTITMPLPTDSLPRQITITVQVQAEGNTLATNHWDVWVYPKPQQLATLSGRTFQTAGRASRHNGVIAVDTLTAQTLQALEQGATVLLTPKHVAHGDDVKQQYLPVFWNTSWFKMRPPHTTGLVINNTHPLFRRFPAHTWATPDWYDLVNNVPVINTDLLPAYHSPVQPVDTWHVSRPLAMIVEARVGKGRLLLTTLPISSGKATTPVRAAMRRAILEYVASTDFQPQRTITPDTLMQLLNKPAPPVGSFTNDSPDELKPTLY